MVTDVAPEGNAGTVVFLPEVGNLLLVTLFLQTVVVGTDVIFRAVHWHLQRVLNFGLSTLEVAEAAVRQVVALTTVGIDRCTGIAKGADEVNKLVSVPLEGVEVVVDENGFRPTFVGHFKGFDNPVVTRLTRTAQCLADVVGVGLVTIDSFVHHVDHGQVGITFLDFIHPFNDSIVTCRYREVFYPTWKLRAPYQRVELKGEFVLLGIVVDAVNTTPVPAVLSTSLNGGPFGLVLWCNLVPQRVEFLLAPVYLT